MTSTEPYTLLESIFIRYEEMKNADVPAEQRFSELKSHIIDLLEVVKEYQLLTLDQIIHAAFVAANNVQDVRLYSLEASLDALKNKKVGMGQLVLEILIIATLEILVVAVAGEALIAIIPAVGALLYRMRQNKRVVAQIGEEVASIEKAIVRRRMPVDDLLESWMDPVPPMGLHFANPAARRIGTPPSVSEGFLITSVIKKQDDLLSTERAARRPGIEAFARERAERALRVGTSVKRAELSKHYQGIYQRYKDLRGPDFLANSLKAVSEEFITNAGKDTSSVEVTDSDNKLTPSAAVVEFVAELQRMKISIINETAYAKSVVRKHTDESTFFQNLDVANVLIELDDLYPRLIYAYDALLSSTHHVAERIEIGIWHVYLKANGLLGFLEVTDVFGRWHDGFFHNGTLLATRKPAFDPMEDTEAKVTGHDFVGIRKLTEQQAQYLFAKFARAQIDEIREYISFYDFTDIYDANTVATDLDELIHSDLSKAVDLPTNNSFGLTDTERARQVRIVKLCVIIFFLRLDEQLNVQHIKSPQFGDEMTGQPFREVLELLIPPEQKEPLPPSTVAPEDDPLQQALKELGFQTMSEVKPELLLLQTELRLLRLSRTEESEWRLPTRQMCEELSELLSQLRRLELTDKQKGRVLELEQQYAESICNRMT